MCLQTLTKSILTTCPPLKSYFCVTSPMSDLVFHSDLNALRATSSNTVSPVRRLSVANSRMKVPTPAVQVTGVSVGLTPFSRFTVPYGIPVGVWNARGELDMWSDLTAACVRFYLCDETYQAVVFWLSPQPSSAEVPNMASLVPAPFRLCLTTCELRVDRPPLHMQACKYTQ